MRYMRSTHKKYYIIRKIFGSGDAKRDEYFDLHTLGRPEPTRDKAMRWVKENFPLDYDGLLEGNRPKSGTYGLTDEQIAEGIEYVQKYKESLLSKAL